MKVVIKVGDVTLTVEGMDLQRRHVRALLMDCAGIAATLAPEAEQASPVGFTAHLERLPDDMADVTYEDED
jgi:hypothetical protein